MGQLLNKRLGLQAQLVELLGAQNVYFQPPATIKMSYPCIVYQLEDFFVTNADDIMYNHKNRYQLTYIDRNPDSDIPLQLQAMEYCDLASTFITDGLNHYVFTLYH